MIRLHQFNAIVEIRTKVVSLSTYLLGLLYVLFFNSEVSLPTALLTLAAILAVDMGTTGFNTYFDFISGVDRKGRREREKVLVYENVSANDAFWISVALYTTALILGVILSLLRGWEIALWGALGMAIGLLYNGGPYPISRTPLGELFAGGALGTLLFFITVALLEGPLTGNTLVASLPSFFMIASILTVNNTCDSEGDALGGRRTLSILLGKRGGEFVVWLLGAAGYGTLFLLFLPLEAAPIFKKGGSLTVVVPLALITIAALLSVKEYRALHRRGFSHETKSASMASISKIFLLYTLSYGASLAVLIVGSR